jgi:hypothetical protein
MERTSLEHRIRERAYEIWNAEGRANGRANEHWLAAEREVLGSVTVLTPAQEATTLRRSPGRRQRGNGRAPAPPAATAKT